jgi:hypothetical protein
LDRMTRRLTGRGNEMRGFYRDKNGIFRVITSDGES